MIEQLPELATVGEAGVDVSLQATHDSKGDANTVTKKAVGSQRAVQLMVIASIGLAIAFLIISCIRLTNSHREVQAQAWRQLAGSPEGGDGNGVCPGEHASEGGDETETQENAEEEPMEIGEEAQQQQESSVGGAAGGDGQQEQRGSMEGLSDGEKAQEDTLPTAEGPQRREEQQEGGSKQGSPRADGEQQERGAMDGKAGGKDEQHPAKGSMGGAAGGEEQQREESMGGAAGGEEQQQEVEPMEIGSGSGGSSRDEKESKTPSPSSDKDAEGATATGTSEESAGGGSGGARPRPSGKRKAKTKHLGEAPKRPPAPTPTPHDTDSDLSDEGETFHWPTGKFYDPTPMDFPPGRLPWSPPPAPPKKGKLPADGAEEKKKKQKKGAKSQALKVRALTAVVDTVLGHADEAAGTGDEQQLNSAVWLMQQLAKSLGVQVQCARQTAGTEEQDKVEEVCLLAEAAITVANDWVVSHGGDVDEEQGAGAATEEDRNEVGVRLLVLKLASTRLSEHASGSRAGSVADKAAALERLLGMAKTLIGGTEKMIRELQATGQSFAARMVSQFLQDVKASEAQCKKLMEEYDYDDDMAEDEGFYPALPTAEQAAQLMLQALLSGCERADSVLNDLAGGADSNVQQTARVQLSGFRSMLTSAERTLSRPGLEDWLLEAITSAAFDLRDKADLIDAALRSVSM